LGPRHVVNTGSVGKPKDGDPRAGYVVLDVDPEREQPLRADFVRVEYDVEKAARAVEESPLPDAFSEALRVAK
jgi:diadenosine tetraphosphatase ApaH/serine/threonine PP2A family protein phosphatase